MADDIYTVVLGDTLSEIAWKFNSTYNYGSTAIAAAQRLGAINDIENIDKYLSVRLYRSRIQKAKRLRKRRIIL